MCMCLGTIQIQNLHVFEFLCLESSKLLLGQFHDLEQTALSLKLRSPRFPDIADEAVPSTLTRLKPSLETMYVCR